MMSRLNAVAHILLGLIPMVALFYGAASNIGGVA